MSWRSMRAGRQPPGKFGQVGFEAAIHAPGRLVEADQPRHLSGFHPAGQGDRQGEPLTLTPGEVPWIPVRRDIQPDRLQGGVALRSGELVTDPLTDQEVPRVLGEERNSP